MKPLKFKKSIKYLLTNYDGVEIHLCVPTAIDQEQKYFLIYNNNGRKREYGKGEIKKKAIAFFKEVSELKLSHAQIEAKLKYLFKSEIEQIIASLNINQIASKIDFYTLACDAFNAFYAYKELQYKDGTVNRHSLYGYKHHHKKLELYFSQPDNKKIKLIDINTYIWLNYRVHLLNNTYGFNKSKLKNSSVNQHFQYIHQFYGWLIDYLELPIKNHLKKLNKLSELKEDKRFKVIDDKTLQEFYYILETHEKYYFTRLYLSALFLYENNVRLSEQVLIQAKDIDLEQSKIRIINNKGSRVRLIKISAKVKELIEIIKTNTIRKGIEITNDMYLMGGHEMFKSGIPHGQKELGIIMRRFRRKYPQFAGRTLYEHKHTSITKQFNSGVDHYQIKERADHSSIKTTEIYLKQNKIVKPFELKLNK